MLRDNGHVDILRRGAKAWNIWRQQNEPLVPKLAGVILKIGEQQLGPINGGPINLSYAELRGAFLRFANLSRANLEAADLADADLAYARLDHAKLSYASLRNARLDHADFSGAKLMKADLSGANLGLARNLDERQLYFTTGDAATILPLSVRRPSAWTERRDEGPSSNCQTLDEVKEHAATRATLGWRMWTRLSPEGVIPAVLVWLIATTSRGVELVSRTPPSDRGVGSVDQ